MPGRRPAGILCPISALPSRFGIGDFGPAADEFIDWLAAAGQTYWQVLPLTIPDSTGSPYASPSRLAGSWLYLSPEVLVREGLLPKRLLPRPVASQRVRYRSVAAAKLRWLRQSFDRFERTARPDQRRRYVAFLRTHREWLADFTLFQAIKDTQGGQPWWRWPKQWQNPRSAYLRLTPSIHQRQRFHGYLQWLFAEQWGRVRRSARRRGIRIVGDLPFYVQQDSVDVWAQPELFLLDRQRRPIAVAGTPPDGFNRRGQRWGNPVYRWSNHRRENFAWWTARLTMAKQRYDLVRFDHFRGLVATWHIPARHADGRRGKWVASPGQILLAQWQRRWPRLPIVAEDLGQSSPLVDRLRRKFRLDSVRVLLFGWNGLPHNFHHPAELAPDSWYYTSTHDTNTVVGWWRDEAKPYERQHLQAYLGRVEPKHIHWQCIEAVYRNREHVAMIPVQDLLGLGSAARFNTPGRKRRNWQWRLPIGSLTPTLAKKLRRLVARRRPSGGR